MTTVVPPGPRGGGEDEEVKFLEIFLINCQKSFEELELERSAHFLLMFNDLVTPETCL